MLKTDVNLLNRAIYKKNLKSCDILLEISLQKNSRKLRVPPGQLVVPAVETPIHQRQAGMLLLQMARQVEQ